jgi:hypothetical protein
LEQENSKPAKMYSMSAKKGRDKINVPLDNLEFERHRVLLN